MAARASSRSGEPCAPGARPQPRSPPWSRGTRAPALRLRSPPTPPPAARLTPAEPAARPEPPPSTSRGRAGTPGAPQGCAGGRAEPRRASSRRPAASPLTGTGRAAGHYSIAGAARPGEAREPSAAQEGAGDHVPRGGGGGGRRRGAALSSPLGGGGGGGSGRGLQEIQTLRQEIGILTKHSRARGCPAPGAPAALNPWPAGTLQGAGVGQCRRRGMGWASFLATEGRGRAYQPRALALKWGLLKLGHQKTVASLPSCPDFS